MKPSRIKEINKTYKINPLFQILRDYKKPGHLEYLEIKLILIKKQIENLTIKEKDCTICMEYKPNLFKCGCSLEICSECMQKHVRTTTCRIKTKLSEIWNEMDEADYNQEYDKFKELKQKANKLYDSLGKYTCPQKCNSISREIELIKFINKKYLISSRNTLSNHDYMSLLGLACKKNLLDIVKILVNIPGVDINNKKLFDNDTKDIDDNSFHYENYWNSPISRTTNIEIKKLLLKHKNIIINEKDFKIVLIVDNRDFIKLLLDNQNINIKGKEIKNISYELPDEFSLFPFLQDELALERLKKLRMGKIKSELSDNRIKKIFGREYEEISEKRYIDNFLILSAKYNNFFAIRLICKKNPSIINLQDESGKTALHWASYNKNHGLISYLKKRGINTKLVDDKGMSANDYLRMNIRPKCKYCDRQFETKDALNHHIEKNCKQFKEFQDFKEYQKS